jgi:hypothetical protein
MKKVKLGDKIILQRDQLKLYDDIVLYTDITPEKILQLPLANLQMIDRQLENLYKTHPKEKK